MIKQLIKTNNDWVGFILRITLGAVLFPHGAQKMLGIWGGYGFNATMAFFTDSIALPWIVAIMVIIIEFLGALSLLVGFASRVWAVLIVMLMMGIIFTSHLENGFFMNWFGNQKGEGFEYHLLMIGLAIALLLNGSGRYSMDTRFENEN